MRKKQSRWSGILVDIATDRGFLSVPCRKLGLFAVYIAVDEKPTLAFSVTHITTGYTMPHRFSNLEAAEECAEILHSQGDAWAFKTHDEFQARRGSLRPLALAAGAL